MAFRSAAVAGFMLASLFAASIIQAQTFTAYGVFGTVLQRMGPGNTALPAEVTGLQSGENMVGIDFNAANEQLYVVTNQNRLYSLNAATRVATQIGTEPFADVAHGVAAFEIIPGTAEARVITSSNHNLRISLVTGQTVATETALSYASGDPHETTSPLIGGAAYGTDNTLYGLDENLNTLVRIGGAAGAPAPAEGSVTTIGALGEAWNQRDSSDGPLNVAHLTIDGMDAGSDGQLYVAKSKSFEILFTGTAFYTVNPVTGLATHIHSQNTAVYPIRAFTVVNDFNPNSDLDGDGVLDPNDVCPNTPPNTYVKENGCPIPNPVDVTPVLVSASEKCNKKGFCKRKIELQVIKTQWVENKTVMVSFYASIDGQVSSNDTLLGAKKAKFNKKTGIAKVKYTAKMADLGLQVVAQVDSANEIAEVDENNNTVAVPKP